MQLVCLKKVWLLCPHKGGQTPTSTYPSHYLPSTALQL